MDLSFIYGFSFKRFLKLLFWILAGIAFVVGSFVLVYVAVHLALLIIAAIVVGFALYLLAVIVYLCIKYLIISIITVMIIDQIKNLGGKKRW